MNLHHVQIMAYLALIIQWASCVLLTGWIFYLTGSGWSFLILLLPGVCTIKIPVETKKGSENG